MMCKLQKTAEGNEKGCEAEVLNLGHMTFQWGNLVQESKKIFNVKSSLCEA